MNFVSLLQSDRISNKHRYRRTRQALSRPSLIIEGLEERTVLSTLTVVPAGFPTDAAHFRTLEAALTAAAPNDTVLIEPGAAASTFNSTTLAANAQAGDTAITTNGLVAPGQVVQIGSETALIDAAAPAGGFSFSLTLHTALANNHSAGDPVAATNRLGIGKTLTVQGDLNAPPAAVADLEVWTGTSGVSLQDLQVNHIQFDHGSSQNALGNSQVGFVADAGSQDLISGNRITGGINLFNSLNNQTVNNAFTGSAQASVNGATGATLKQNTFDVAMAGNNADVIEVRMSDNITISNNRITFHASAVSVPDKGMAILVEDGGVPTHVTIRSNVVSTAGLGIGIFTYAVNGAKLFVKVQGNELRDNRVGLLSLGDGSTNATAAGTIDAGGGTLGSLGGNNFRGFTNDPGALNAGTFALYLTNQGVNAGTIMAQNNLWSVADPNTVIKDATHNHTTGGQPYGDGAINVGATQLDANHQFVQTLYEDFLGRTGAPAELDGWVAALGSAGRGGVANAILRAPESLTHLVDKLYLEFFNRPADPGGEAGWVAFLQQGGTEEQLIANLLSSPEYYNHASTLNSSISPDANFLAALYRQLLGRPGSAAEINNWLAVLPTLGRAAVATAFVTSAEYRTDQVLGFYAQLLHRGTPPPTAEVATAVNSALDLLSLEVQFAGSADFFSNG
jgi:hypothetical protein